MKTTVLDYKRIRPETFKKENSRFGLEDYLTRLYRLHLEEVLPVTSMSDVYIGGTTLAKSINGFHENKNVVGDRIIVFKHIRGEVAPFEKRYRSLDDPRKYITFLSATHFHKVKVIPFITNEPYPGKILAKCFEANSLQVVLRLKTKSLFYGPKYEEFKENREIQAFPFVGIKRAIKCSMWAAKNTNNSYFNPKIEISALIYAKKAIEYASNEELQDYDNYKEQITVANYFLKDLTLITSFARSKFTFKKAQHERFLKLVRNPKTLGFLLKMTNVGNQKLLKRLLRKDFKESDLKLVPEMMKKDWIEYCQENELSLADCIQDFKYVRPFFKHHKRMIFWLMGAYRDHYPDQRICIEKVKRLYLKLKNSVGVTILNPVKLDRFINFQREQRKDTELNIRELTSLEQLKIEGSEMHNCLGRHHRGEGIKEGREKYFSLYYNRDRSTVHIVMNKGYWTISEHKGPCNSIPNFGLQKLARDLLAYLNNYEEEFENEQNIEDTREIIREAA